MKEKLQDYFKGNYSAFFGKYLPETKKIGGDEYAALCPFHEDGKPSLNFNNQTGQYFCHGCGKKGHAFHFYAKLHSLDTRRDFPKILKSIANDFGIPWEGKKGQIVKLYDYLSADCQLLYQVVRMDPKDFRQRRPNGDGGWIWDMKGVQPVLYRLPEVLKAQEVIIVEGEKDTDALRSIGYTATTCPMGAKKWKDEYSEALRGKDIVLIPDNDNEGREHMTQVGASLNGKAKSLKWLDLPNLPSKGDVSDWVAKFEHKEDAAERLAIMIEGADLYTPHKKASLEDIILTVKEFTIIDLPEKRIFLEPWLKENSINLISGWRGAGKTFMALGIADAVTNGKSFGPWKCEAPVPCLFLDGEMPVQDVIERIQTLGLNSDLLHIYCDAHANQFGLPRAHLANESWRVKMKSILLTRKVKLFIVDNLASLASGLDENSKKDWDPINQWLLELRFAGISTLMLHHTNKEGGQRGTSAREDNIDSSITLKIPHDYTPEDGARFIVHFTKSRIPTASLPLITDTEFRLTQDELGFSVWTIAGIKKERKREILRLLDEGMSQTEIRDLLEVDKGYVSRIRKNAIKNGFLTEKNKLTQSGFHEVQEQEI